MLGGLVNFTASTVSAIVATHSRKRTAGEALLGVFRAEAVRIVLIVAQLWLVLATYERVVPLAFFGTFILTVIFFSMAILIRDR